MPTYENGSVLVLTPLEELEGWGPGSPTAATSPVVLTAEIARRGLVRRDNSFSSLHRGVSWDKDHTKWCAVIKNGGKKGHLGYFATVVEAKVCHDARCLELGRDSDTATSSDFRGVTWLKADHKWNV